MRNHDRSADWSGAELNLAAQCADHFVCRGQLCVRDCGALGRSRAQDVGRAAIRVRRLQVLGPHGLLFAVSAPPQPVLAVPVAASRWLARVARLSNLCAGTAR